MPLFTFSYCMICYKKDAKTVQPPPPKKEYDPVELYEEALKTFMREKELLSKKREVCRRFGTLATRYLGVDPYHFFPNRTLRSKREINNDHCCDACLPTLASFCELYDCWKYLELQMNQRVNEIAKLMTTADKVNCEWKAALVKDLENIGDTTTDLNDFRKEFMYHAFKKTATAFPRIPLERDADFIPVKIIVVKKCKVKKEGNTISKSNPALSSSTQTKSRAGGVKTVSKSDRIKRRRSSSSSSNESLFSPIIRKRDSKTAAQEDRPATQKRSSPRSPPSNYESNNGKQAARLRNQSPTGNSSRSTEVLTLEDSDDSPDLKPAMMKRKKKRSSVESGNDDNRKKKSDVSPSGRVLRRGRPRKDSSDKGRNSGGQPKPIKIKFNFKRRHTDG